MRHPPVGQGLLIQEVSRSHTTHHSPQDSSGRVISTSQRPLPDNTQHSQQTSMPLVGFEPTISAGERPQTYALDRAATGTGNEHFNGTKLYWFKIWDAYAEISGSHSGLDEESSLLRCYAVSTGTYRYSSTFRRHYARLQRRLITVLGKRPT